MMLSAAMFQERPGSNCVSSDDVNAVIADSVSVSSNTENASKSPSIKLKAEVNHDVVQSVLISSTIKNVGHC